MDLATNLYGNSNKHEKLLEKKKSPFSVTPVIP